MQPGNLTDNRAARLKVSGKVQGVWFRASTEKEAVRLGINGWVKNCNDGSVQIWAEGSNLEEFIQWCHEGPPQARVDSV